MIQGAGHRLLKWLPLVYTVVVLGTALVRVGPTGDCGEYIVMARALATRGSPDVRDPDAYWLARRERRLAGVAGALHRTISRDKPDGVGTVRAPSGRYYSIHFWFYSLLAAPALLVLEAVRWPPLLALTAVNAAAALAAGLYAARCFRGSWVGYAAPFLFLFTGSTFYLRATGPEVLTAAGVFVAWLAAGRRELGLGFLAAGIAATQNPSAAALFPFVAFETWRLQRGAAGSGTTGGTTGAWRPHPRTLELGTAGVLLALLPYLFFQLEYGVPSLIGRYSTDFRLIGFERAWSLFFDLNQGMVLCLPGLFAGLVAVFSPRPSRSAPHLVRLATTLALVVVMAVPTLAAPNWNSGSIVLMRYGYWLAMPLVALLCELLSARPLRAAVPPLAAFAGLTLAVLVVNGFRGGASSYLRHSWLASAVLARMPSAYDPVIEIFVERSVGRESAPREDRPVTWPRHGPPKKVLVHERGRAAEAPECPPGTPRLSEHVTRLAGGWEYQNGPFRCGPRPVAPASSASAEPD